MYEEQYYYQVNALKNFTNNTISNFIFAALSGILLALSFSDPAINAFAWVAFIPLFFAIRRSDVRTAPLLGLTFGMVFFAIVLYWIQVFGFIAWISLSLFLSIWTIVFAVGVWAIFRHYRGIAQLILIPSLWALCEFARSLGPLGFAWANVGSTVDNLLLLKIASYIGEWGLSLTIVLVNLMIFQLIVGSTKRESIRVVASGVALLAVIVLAGPVAELIVSGRHSETSAEKLTVAIVQPNVQQTLKLDLSNNDDIKSIYLAMTKQALISKPDLIIWPESVFATMISDEQDYLSRVTKLISPTKTQLILGGLSSDEQGHVFNNATFINQREEYRSYQKIHLVPFGEYMPLRSLIKRINNMADLVQDRTPGKYYRVFSMEKGARHIGKFSTIICFESSDTRLVARMVKNGAKALVVITNDGWFGKTAALEQHFQITRMRAAEYGIPVIQAANTGISGVISRDGKVTARATPNKPQVLYSSIAFSQEPSFYSRIGYLMPYLYLAIIVAGLFYKAIKPTQGQPSTNNH